MYNVILIDDEPLVKIALRSLIDWEANGYHICATASNGEEALPLIYKLKPQIVITDLKMSKINGIELISILKENKYECQILILSNYSDYEHVREALKLGAKDYLLKISLQPNELLAQLNNCVKSLLSDMPPITSNTELHPLLWKDFLVNNIISENNKAYFHNINNFYFIVMKWKNKKENTSQSYKSILPTLKEVSNIISDENTISLKPNEMLIILTEDLLLEKGLILKDLSNKIYLYMEQFLFLDVLLLYSSLIPDYEKSPLVFKPLIENFNYSFYKNSACIRSECIKLQPYINFTDYRSFSEKIWKFFKEDKKESVINLFHIFLEHCKNDLIHPELVIRYLLKIVNYLDICLTETNQSKLNSIEDKIMKCDNISDLYLTLEQYTILISNFLQTKHPLHRRETINCLHYINSNYRKKLTLDEISDFVSLNEKYLCRIFKEDMGISIIQYINKLKMEQAATMLKKQDILVKEVADYIGISDQFYFNRLFKKHYSVSPSSYQKNSNNVGSESSQYLGNGK